MNRSGKTAGWPHPQVAECGRPAGGVRGRLLLAALENLEALRFRGRRVGRAGVAARQRRRRRLGRVLTSHCAAPGWLRRPAALPRPPRRPGGQTRSAAGRARQRPAARQSRSSRAPRPDAPQRLVHVRVAVTGVRGEHAACHAGDHRLPLSRCLYAVPGVPPGGRFVVEVGGSRLPTPRPYGTAHGGPDGRRRQPAAALAAAMAGRRGTGLFVGGRRRERGWHTGVVVPVDHDGAPIWRWFTRNSSLPGGEVPGDMGVALQGGPRPHSPAVARGHRATSPVGP